MNIVDHHRRITANAGTATARTAQDNDENNSRSNSNRSTLRTTTTKDTKHINEMKQKFRKFLVNHLGSQQQQQQQQRQTETESETKSSSEGCTSHQENNNIITNRKSKKQIFRNNDFRDDDDDDDDDDKTIPTGYYRNRNRNRNQHLPLNLSSTLADHEDGINSILFHSQRRCCHHEDGDDCYKEGCYSEVAGGDGDYSDVDEDYDIERELMERFSQQFVVDSLRFSFRDDYDLQDYYRYDDGYGGTTPRHHQKDKKKMQHQRPESKLESCLELLSSNDLDQNRLGLQRLNLLTKGRALSSLHRSEELASFAVIYGTTNIHHREDEEMKGRDGKYYHIRNHPGGSVEERLRYVFATYICDAPHDDTAMINRSSFMDLPFVKKNDDDDDDDDSATFSVYYDDGDDEQDDEEKDGDEFKQDIDEHADDDGYDDDFFQELDRLVDLSDLTKHRLPGDEHIDEPQAQSIIEEDQTSHGSSDTEETEDSDEDGITGKAWGALHNQALRVLANALSQITPSPYCSTNSDNDNDDDDDDDVQRKLEADLLRPRIPLGDTIWRNIIQTLVRNIRNNPNADITGYSLKIVKLLHTLHPTFIQPLLSQTLFPHLVHLAEYGEGHRFPVIHQEATALLKRAKASTNETSTN